MAHFLKITLIVNYSNEIMKCEMIQVKSLA